MKRGVSKGLRVLAIIQLCMAFTMLASHAGYPFMGELFEVKSRKLLYEAVIGKESEAVASFYSALPEGEKAAIEREYRELQERSQASFISRLSSSAEILIFKLSPFERAWLVFSIIIPVLLLLGVEGASSAVWVLPLIVAAFQIENFMYGQEASAVNEGAFFPSEKYIVERYIEGGLRPEIREQRMQLLEGWRLYLTMEWAGEQPSEDPARFREQAERGEFFFNLGRLQMLSKVPRNVPFSGFREKKPFLLLFAYLLWNLFFAYYANFRRHWKINRITLSN